MTTLSYSGFKGLGERPNQNAGYVPQPYYAHVDFWVGGVLLTGGAPTVPRARSAGGVQNFTLQSFTHVRQADGNAGVFSIVLFDPTFTSIEEHLGRYGQNVQFQYYYVSANGTKSQLSRVFGGRIAKWKPTFSMAGVTLEIDGFGFLVGGFKVKNLVFGGDVSDREPDVAALINKYKGNEADNKLSIETFVELVCSGELDSDKGKSQSKPWWVDFGDGAYEPGKRSGDGKGKIKPIKDFDGLTATATATKLYAQGWSSDAVLLQKFAKQATPTGGKENSVGYDVWTSEEEVEGKVRRIVHFKPKTLADKAPPKRIFTYLYGFKDSEVISFTPSVDIEFMPARGGQDVQSTGVNTTTRDTYTVQAHEQAGGDRSYHGSNQTFTLRQEPPNPSSPSFIMRQQFKTITEAKNLTYSTWYQQYLFGNYADLLIQGDPSLSTFDPIHLWVLLPKGLTDVSTTVGGAEVSVHPTSGPYRINKVTNSITPGSWTTSLELFRVGSFYAQQAQTGSPDVFPPSEALLSPVQLGGGTLVLPHAKFPRAENWRRLPTPGEAINFLTTTSQDILDRMILDDLYSMYGRLFSTLGNFFNQLGDLFDSIENAFDQIGDFLEDPGSFVSWSGVDLQVDFGGFLSDGTRLFGIQLGGEVNVEINSPLSGTIIDITASGSLVIESLDHDGIVFILENLASVPSELVVGGRITAGETLLGLMSLEGVIVKAKSGNRFLDPKQFISVPPVPIGGT